VSKADGTPLDSPPIIAARSEQSISTVQVGIVAFALVNLAIAAMLVFAPHAFFEDVGPYGAQNDHYMRDLATFYAASGIVGLIAARRSSWRTPVLWLLAIEYGLHAINHLIDIDAAHSSWLGPANFASLAIATVALLWLARESARSPEVRKS
jgi:hypothetical protein